ncbi:hypothetical protein K7472_30860 [Streptomyces sp. PTM05]|uniref:Uncharacterized protein n=1 Tax=Streptantibioticus parmotrematis TaxID=2873249 RepID=A0ABS7R3V9_9ACTN|nr:DUF6302 family protein [Streptantibioticus parmotrematis]MBY8889215.1 hypothetical protein [Streptantibioticus parmotrematis]
MNLLATAAGQHDRTRTSLSVEILPAREAYDYEFVAARLHDQGLLAGSVAVRIFRAPLLAVPVGGCRRGRRTDIGPVTAALAVRSALLGRPGFPLLRVSLSRDARGESWLVEWGEQALGHRAGTPERLRFFGYSDCGRCRLSSPVALRPCANTVGLGVRGHQRETDTTRHL